MSCIGDASAVNVASDYFRYIRSPFGITSRLPTNPSTMRPQGGSYALNVGLSFWCCRTKPTNRRLVKQPRLLAVQ